MDTVSSSESSSSGQVATTSTSTSTTTTTSQPSTTQTTNDEQPRVEVSIVGSPEVFGAQETVTVTKSSGSPDSHEERVIERCDVAASPSDPRPPKKRYGSTDAGSAEVPPAESPSGAQLPRAAPPPSAFCDARQVPTGEQFLQLLYNWQWVEIDNVQLPSVMRGGERFLAVHMVQLKLLSKFPPAIPAEIISRFTMVSHKMSTVEAWQFNAINAIKRKFDLGCQLFTTQDEVVRLNDVQMFYWNVKALNLSRIIQQYDAELQNTNGNLTLIATIQSLKNHVEADLERVRLEVDGKQLPQSVAIVRYLARKFGYAGKSAWEEAVVDSIADQFKDFLNEVRPYFKVLLGMDQGDLKALEKDVFEPARQKFFTIVTKILKENKTGYLVGDSLTFADLYVAEMTTFTEHYPKLYDGFPEVKAHAEKVRSNPKLKKWIETRPASKF